MTSTTSTSTTSMLLLKCDDQYRLINLNGLAFCAHVTPLWFVSTRVSILTLVPSSAQMCVPEEAEMVLSVDDNAHYWQQHPHSSSATSQMSGLLASN